MRTDHEELCGTSYGPFCLNGGICYMIPTVSGPFCRCIENYTGARCEEVLLPSFKTQIKSELFAAFLASVVVLGLLVIGAFYFLCRILHPIESQQEALLRILLFNCKTPSVLGTGIVELFY
ncbi:pro-neuregulin-4, membrane-bound isoform isoform X2 [Pelodiscus sinensis]|uniref:pro-neuregulin-4, membrane-bound isoform isoform X2 n=1 Tax=Pelodiscus sinensis TaxID=13735 RepID=UPI003F6B0129